VRSRRDEEAKRVKFLFKTRKGLLLLAGTQTLKILRILWMETEKPTKKTGERLSSLLSLWSAVYE
jgi:hypothetical protein